MIMQKMTQDTAATMANAFAKRRTVQIRRGSRSVTSTSRAGSRNCSEWIEKQLRFFRDQVEGLDIAEDIKKVVPSRCQISDK